MAVREVFKYPSNIDLEREIKSRGMNHVKFIYHKELIKPHERIFINIDYNSEKPNFTGFPMSYTDFIDKAIYQKLPIRVASNQSNSFISIGVIHNSKFFPFIKGNERVFKELGITQFDFELSYEIE